MAWNAGDSASPACYELLQTLVWIRPLTRFPPELATRIRSALIVMPPAPSCNVSSRVICSTSRGRPDANVLCRLGPNGSCLGHRSFFVVLWQLLAGHRGWVSGGHRGAPMFGDSSDPSSLRSRDVGHRVSALNTRVLQPSVFLGLGDPDSHRRFSRFAGMQVSCILGDPDTRKSKQGVDSFDAGGFWGQHLGARRMFPEQPTRI